MPLTGDFSALAKLQAKLINTKVVPFKVAQRVTPEVNATIQARFQAKANFYGDAWKPLNPKSFARGSKSIGIRSGTLMGSIVAMPQANKIRVPLGTEYGKYMIAAGRSPYPKGRLPAAWQPIIARHFDEAMREALA